MSDEWTHGLFECAARPGKREGAKLTVAALRRLETKSGPFQCPVCRTSCGPKFIPATPSGEGMILVHTDDEDGGRWERQMAWTVSFPRGG